ncbi:MAG: glycosyl transferase family 2, partial [Chthonomonadaceae bacterium]|nr:glycosyl transferase family 2 [Chthonomonadaceae bacterium]
NTFRMGFAANHNQAIKASVGEHVFVLNEDTVVHPGALKALCDFLDTHPDVGAVGPRLENPDGTLQKSCYRFPSPGRVIAENLLLVAAFPNNPLWGDYRAFEHDRLRYVDFVSGAAFLVRREVIEKTGVLDDGFFIYSEETDWQLRMHKDGWKVAFIPEVTIVHYGGQSSVAIKDRQFCEFHRSQLRFMRKHYTPVGEFVARVSMCQGAVLRMTLWSLMSVVKPSKRAELKPQIELWGRILKWYLGKGPHEGIRELAQQQAAQQAAVPPAA